MGDVLLLQESSQGGCMKGYVQYEWLENEHAQELLNLALSFGVDMSGIP